MTAGKCGRCRRYWFFSGNPLLFEVIGDYCPDCVSLLFPVVSKP